MRVVVGVVVFRYRYSIWALLFVAGHLFFRLLVFVVCSEDNGEMSDSPSASGVILLHLFGAER